MEHGPVQIKENHYSGRQENTVDCEQQQQQNNRSTDQKHSVQNRNVGQDVSESTTHRTLQNHTEAKLRNANHYWAWRTLGPGY